MLLAWQIQYPQISRVWMQWNLYHGVAWTMVIWSILVGGWVIWQRHREVHSGDTIGFRKKVCRFLTDWVDALSRGARTMGWVLLLTCLWLLPFELEYQEKYHQAAMRYRAAPAEYWLEVERAAEMNNETRL